MTSPAKRMTAALKRRLIPALTATGFDGRFPRYRRVRGDVIHLLMIAYDKAAESFFLEFGAHPRGDKHTTWGEIVPEDKLLLEHVLFQQRARLQERCDGGSLPDQWFRFAECGEDDDAYDRLAAQVAGMLPQMEAWFMGGGGGLNVSPNGP